MAFCDFICFFVQNPILVNGAFSWAMVLTGSIFCFLNRKPVQDEIDRLGSDTKWLGTVNFVLPLALIIILGVSTLSLLPAIFSVTSIRKSYFSPSTGEAGCGACLRKVVKEIFGNLLTVLLEFSLFITVIAALAVTCAFCLAAAVLVLLLSICSEDKAQDTAKLLVEELVKNNSTTTFGQVITGLNITYFCEGKVTAELENDGQFLFIGGVLVLIGVIVGFMVVGRAKEVLYWEMGKTIGAGDGDDESEMQAQVWSDGAEPDYALGGRN